MLYQISEGYCLVEISGNSCSSFLDSLSTNFSQKLCYYGCLLNGKGRFIADFFRYKISEDLIIIEIEKTLVDEFIERVSFYDIRSSYKIRKINASIFFLTNNKIDQQFCDKILLCRDENIIIATDPRKENQFRVILFPKILDAEEFDINIITNQSLHNFKEYIDYHILNKIPIGSFLLRNRSIILEFGFRDINAINFKKGCYVGQELIARAVYQGAIRKSLKIVSCIDCEKTDILISNSSIPNDIFNHSDEIASYKHQIIDNEDLIIGDLIACSSGRNYGLILAEEFNTNSTFKIVEKKF